MVAYLWKTTISLYLSALQFIKDLLRKCTNYGLGIALGQNEANISLFNILLTASSQTLYRRIPFGGLSGLWAHWRPLFLRSFSVMSHDMTLLQQAKKSFHFTDLGRDMSPGNNIYHNEKFRITICTVQSDQKATKSARQINIIATFCASQARKH